MSVWKNEHVATIFASNLPLCHCDFTGACGACILVAAILAYYRSQECKRLLYVVWIAEEVPQLKYHVQKLCLSYGLKLVLQMSLF